MGANECKRFQELRYQVAFERCIDVMTRLILKYGPTVLEKMNEEEKYNHIECNEEM